MFFNKKQMLDNLRAFVISESKDYKIEKNTCTEIINVIDTISEISKDINLVEYIISRNIYNNKKMTLIPNEYQKGINEGFEISKKEFYKLNNEIKQLRLHSVTKNIAKEYAKFCVKCDREGLPILELEDYIKQYCY